MILWLASYPRSGNTMLRTMMNQAFGLRSFSIYDDRLDIGANVEIRQRAGHEFLNKDFEQFYQERRHSGELSLVKTHDSPMDDSDAIYIIRDGRSAIVSWYNFLVRWRKRSDIDVSDIIRGERIRFGDWSSHVRAWNPAGRPRTLLLRYPDLIAKPDDALTRISAFIDRPRTGAWENDFDLLHRSFPEFFHQGSDAKNLAQMTPAENDLFWSMHEACMREFGFAKE